MNIFKKLFLFKFLFLIASIFYAVDPSVYYGNWISKSDNLTIEINIGDSRVKSVKINNKFLKYIKFEYLYGKNATTPFLYIFSKEGKIEKGYINIEHNLYLILGCEGENCVIKGFYELDKIRDDNYGTSDCVTYSVEFIEKK